MAFEIKIPRLGWTMEEGVFVEWLKRDGDVVATGDAIFTLEGDKITDEIEAVDAGILRIPQGAPKPGDSVLVGVVIAFLVDEGEDVPALGEVSPASGGSEESSGGARSPEVRMDSWTADVSGPSISPRAARRALELGIDYRSIVGTGRSGRIRERDIVAAAANRMAEEFGKEGVPREAATSARSIIANRVASSSRNTAAVTITSTVDAAALVATRKRLAEGASDYSAPTYNDLLIGIVAAALRKHPDVNVWWLEGAPSPRTEVNVGFAVDVNDSLVVPVVRRADTLDVHTIAARTRQLIARARSASLSSEDVADGTFTITNLGMFGVDGFSAIIHEPQIAILGAGRIREAPRVCDGQLVPGVELSLSLTFDHRSLDGAPAARFLQTVCLSIEGNSPQRGV